MPDMNGSFSGKARLQTAVSLTDVAGHELQVTEIRGSQHSNDPNWDKAELTYWGIADIINGNGTQRGTSITSAPMATGIAARSKAK
jgi:hypothetical protein